MVLTCVKSVLVCGMLGPSSSESHGLGEWVLGDSGVMSESWVW